MKQKKRKKKARSEYQKLKKECSDWLSRRVRLRDAANAQMISRTYGSGYVQCYTCSKVDHIKNMQAGHCIGRGLGGHSGVYFAEENVHTQCVQCNGFRGGNRDVYEPKLDEEYGEGTVERLKVLHKTNSYDKTKLTKLLLYYQVEVERLLKKTGIIKWW